MAINTPWKIKTTNTRHGETVEYLPILVQDNAAPTDDTAVQVGTDKPENAINFSLSAQLESGRLQWVAYEKDGEDFSNGTLESLINSGSLTSAEVNRLQERFGTDDTGDYIVNSITEQRIWLKEYIHDSGLNAESELKGPSWTNRVSTTEGEYTPIFITSADIEPLPDRPFEGNGRVSFQLGERL